MAANTALTVIKNSTLRTPIIRDMVKGRELLVCVPTIDFDKLRELNPDARTLAYWDMTTVAQYGWSEFWKSLRAKMEKHYLVGGTGTGRGATHWYVTNEHGNYELQMTLAAAEDYAAFINDRTDERFDGVYLDQCWGAPSEDWEDRRPDPDRDVERWQLYATRFLECLGFGTVVGNIGSYLDLSWQSNLTGITREPHGLWPRRRAIRAFSEFDPAWNIAWSADEAWDIPDLCLRGDILP